MLFFLHTNQIQYWVRGKKDLTFQEAEILLSDLTLRNARRKKRATQSYKYVLTGLLGYQNYEAQMRVVNTYYAGPPSVITSFTTELGGNHIRISWFGFFFSDKGIFFLYKLNLTNHFLIFFFINCQQETHNFFITTNFTFLKMAKIVVYVLVKPLFFD